MALAHSQNVAKASSRSHPWWHAILMLMRRWLSSKQGMLGRCIHFARLHPRGAGRGGQTLRWGSQSTRHLHATHLTPSMHTLDDPGFSKVNVHAKGHSLALGAHALLIKHMNRILQDPSIATQELIAELVHQHDTRNIRPTRPKGQVYSCTVEILLVFIVVAIIVLIPVLFAIFVVGMVISLLISIFSINVVIHLPTFIIVIILVKVLISTFCHLVLLVLHHFAILCHFHILQRGIAESAEHPRIRFVQGLWQSSRNIVVYRSTWLWPCSSHVPSREQLEAPDHCTGYGGGIALLQL